MGVKILSLFDGMACGMLAMQKAGVDVEEYTAYEIDKYAIQTVTHNFPMIKECGDVFKADFTQYEGIDYVVGGSPCVPAGTKVKTDKGYKNIEDMTIGDMVLTHKNRYRPVSRLYKKVTNHLYHIRFNGNKDLRITGNHPVYTYRDGEFCFVRTDELTTNDYVCININQANIPMDYSDDIMWLAGRALADGYLSTDKNAIVIAVGKKKIPDFEIHLQGLHYYVCHKDRPAVDYVIKDERLVGLYSYFGNNKATAKEIPDVILNLPVGQSKLVFDGYMSGDGFKRKDKPNVQMWCSSSEVLTLSMGLLTAKLFHKYPTISVRDGEYKKLPSGFCHTKTSYSSQISVTNRKNNDIQVIGDKLLIKIKSIEKESIEADVFNIETAEDHSYTVDNCIVHNCTYWSIAQKNNRETEASGLGWELFSQYVRAIHEAKPKFFIYENNKSMSNAIRESISKEFGFEPICINSALVSAQNRNRLYWVGKRNPDGTYSKVDVKQPEDRGILLKNILDGTIRYSRKTGVLDSKDKSLAVCASDWRGINRNQVQNAVIEPVNISVEKDGDTDVTYSKVDVEQPEDRGILLKDILDSGSDFTTNDKSWTLTASYNGAVPWNTIERCQRNMVAEPVNTTVGDKSHTIKAQYYKNGIANFITNGGHNATAVAEPVGVSQRGIYTESGNRSSKCEGGTEQFVEARTDGKSNCVTTVQKDSMVAVPVNPTADGKAQCLRATCYKDGTRNIVGNNTDRKTGVAEPVIFNTPHGYNKGGVKYDKSPTLTANGSWQSNNFISEPVRVGALPRPNGELSTSQGFRVYSTEGKSVGLKGNAGGTGGKTGLYAIPVEFENDKPIKATSCADGKTYTVYEVKDGLITIKGKQYPIKLIDGYYIIRKLTVSECKRLQTVPEWYEFQWTEYIYQRCYQNKGDDDKCRNVKLKDVISPSQAGKLNYAINTILDTYVTEQLNLPDRLLIEAKNVSLKDVREPGSRLSVTASSTIKNGKDDSQLTQQKNVQFAVNQLGTLDAMECVVSIITNGEDTEIHYIGKNDYLNPMEIKGVNIIKHKTESGFIESLLKRYWEENSCQTKSYITSILINWIIAKAIYMCVKTIKNTSLYIDSWSELQRNSLIWELSSLQMGNIGGVSDSSAYKMLGNGWTVDVIAHLIESTLKENTNDS